MESLLDIFYFYSILAIWKASFTTIAEELNQNEILINEGAL